MIGHGDGSLKVAWDWPQNVAGTKKDGRMDIEEWQRKLPGMAQFLGVRLLKVEPDMVVAEMVVPGADHGFRVAAQGGSPSRDAWGEVIAGVSRWFGQ